MVESFTFVYIVITNFSRPTLVIDRQKASHNLKRMQEKAIHSGTIFRPHFKTHQSAEIGLLFREKGVARITVSSVSMATFFADHGWKDITIAFPVNLRELEELDLLATRVSLNLLTDSAYSTGILCRRLKNRAGVFVEIDNGYHRSGLLPEQHSEIDQVITLLNGSANLTFRGFLTHAGDTYAARGREAILKIMEGTAATLNALRRIYAKDFPEIITSFGDTPSCSLADDLCAFDEVRPGNFIYYDVMQYHIGSCALEDVAVVAACPVVSVIPQREEIIIYGGAVHLSKEHISGDGDFSLFGYVVPMTKGGWGDPIPGAYVSSLSQEHGIIRIPSGDLRLFKPGDVVGILPVHSCLTADLLKHHSILI